MEKNTLHTQMTTMVAEQPARSAVGRLPVYWLAAMALHWLEEVPTFPAWASAHFAPMSPAWFVGSHVPLFILAGVIAIRASRPVPTRSAVWASCVLASVLAANTAFHVGATITFREYAPGLGAALLLYLPLAVMSVRPFAAALGRWWRIAAAAGVLVSALVVASLWIDTQMP